MEQRQRIDVTVIRGPGRAADGRSDARQHRRQFVAPEHSVLEAEIPGLAAHLLHHCAPLRDLLLAEAELQPAILLETDRDPGALLQCGRQRRPFRGGGAGPPLVMRRTEPLALHPDEPEIAARGAIGDIALVDQRDLEPVAPEPVGDRRTDQPAADHDRVEASHRVSLDGECSPPGSAGEDHSAAIWR